MVYLGEVGKLGSVQSVQFSSLILNSTYIQFKITTRTMMDNILYKYANEYKQVAEFEICMWRHFLNKELTQ